MTFTGAQIVLRAPQAISLPTTVILTLAALGSAAIGFVGPTYPLPALVLLLLAPIIAFASVAPRHLLPTLALLSILVIPAESLPLPALAKAVPIGLLLLVIWQLRITPTQSIRMPTLIVVCGFTIWLVMSFLFASILSPRSVTWSVGAFIALGLFSLRPPPAHELFRALKVFTVAASVLAGMAVLESFVLGYNPILGDVFAASNGWARGTAPGIHRATTLIGHPLMNGTFFSVACVLVLSRIFDTSHPNRSTDYVQLCLLILGIAASQTRTGAISVLVGLLLIVAVNNSPNNLWRRLIFLGAGAVLLGFFALALAQRNAAGLEFTYNHRAVVPGAALASIQGHEVFGVGPSMSDAWRLSKQLPGTSVTLENSYAQLFVSLGPVGMILFVMNLLVAIVTGFTEPRRRIAAAGLATFSLALAGFNAIEGSPRMFVLLAVLISATYAYSPPGNPVFITTKRDTSA